MKTSTRKPGAVRREEIADAALRIIGERGLTALSTAKLAADVGLTSGALFRHFASRDEILCHATRCAVERVEASFPDESLPPVERLLALARNRIRLVGADPGLAWLLRSEQALLVLPAEAATLLRNLVRRTKRFILDTIRAGAADGTIRDDLEPEVLLVPFTGTVHALMGMSGFQKMSATRRRGTDRVLEGLMRLFETNQRS